MSSSSSNWMRFILMIFLLVLIAGTLSYPVIENDDYVDRPHSRHHHHKHHIRHKHHRRSLKFASDEDTKTQRNKQIMLTKPYWPWP